MLVGIDCDLGRIYYPALGVQISLPNRPVRRAIRGEFGLFVAKQMRPRIRMVERGGVLIPETLGYDVLWSSITHNERVDAGASYQARQAFGAGASPAAPSATVYFNVIAVASASISKTKTDQSLGSASSGVTTNEFTTVGLSRVTATTPIAGDYTAPSTLGGTFSQVVKYTFTASGAGGTAYGAGIFNSTTVAGSILYVEDLFSSSATLIASDTLAVTATISN